MGDSWDDDDFQVPDLVVNITNSNVKKEWDDEEEEVVMEEVVAKPSEAQILASKKKAQKEEEALANALKFALEENETPEQKKARERMQAEEADTELSSELFGNNTNTTSKSSTTGLGSIPLKTKQDHSNFAILCSKKMKDSTPLNVGAFYKNVTDKLKDVITTETLDEVLMILNSVRDERRKLEIAKKPTQPKKTKKEMAAERKRHDDVFGDATETNSKYDRFTDLEDDFM
jgi:hypothetical protein